MGTISWKRSGPGWTLTEARDTAVMGSSLGGVVSLFLAWQWPEVFGYRDDLR